MVSAQSKIHDAYNINVNSAKSGGARRQELVSNANGLFNQVNTNFQPQTKQPQSKPKFKPVSPKKKLSSSQAYFESPSSSRTSRPISRPDSPLLRTTPAGICKIQREPYSQSRLASIFTFIIILVPTAIEVLSPHLNHSDFSLAHHRHLPAYSKLLIDMIMLVLVSWLVKFLMEWPWFWFERVKVAQSQWQLTAETWAEEIRLPQQDHEHSMHVTPHNPYHKRLSNLQMARYTAFCSCVAGPFLGAYLMVASRQHFVIERYRQTSESVVFNDFNVVLFLTWGAIRFIRQLTKTVEENTTQRDSEIVPVPTSIRYEVELQRLRSNSQVMFSELQQLNRKSATELLATKRTIEELREQVSKRRSVGEVSGPRWSIHRTNLAFSQPAIKQRKAVPVKELSLVAGCNKENEQTSLTPSVFHSSITQGNSFGDIPETAKKAPAKIGKEKRRSILLVTKDTGSDTYSIVARERSGSLSSLDSSSIASSTVASPASHSSSPSSEAPLLSEIQLMLGACEEPKHANERSAPKHPSKVRAHERVRYVQYETPKQDPPKLVRQPQTLSNSVRIMSPINEHDVHVSSSDLNLNGLHGKKPTKKSKVVEAPVEETPPNTAPGYSLHGFPFSSSLNNIFSRSEDSALLKEISESYRGSGTKFDTPSPEDIPSSLSFKIANFGLRFFPELPSQLRVAFPVLADAIDVVDYRDLVVKVLVYMFQTLGTMRQYSILDVIIFFMFKVPRQCVDLWLRVLMFWPLVVHKHIVLKFIDFLLHCNMIQLSKSNGVPVLGEKPLTKRIENQDGLEGVKEGTRRGEFVGAIRIRKQNSSKHLKDTIVDLDPMVRQYFYHDDQV